MEEEVFEKVVKQIFNNWSALKLVVEHSLGGPNSKQTATECMNYMVKYCLYQSNLDVDDIEEALNDILNEEFNTICEDNSPKEIAAILFKFVQLLKEGNLEQLEIDYQSLPTMNQDWLTTAVKTNPVQATSDDSDVEEEEGTSNSQQIPMEQESEWTEVKSKRKR